MVMHLWLSFLSNLYSSAQVLSLAVTPSILPLTLWKPSICDANFLVNSDSRFSVTESFMLPAAVQTDDMMVPTFCNCSNMIVANSDEGYKLAIFAMCKCIKMWSPLDAYMRL